MKNSVHELYALERLAAGNTSIHRLHPLAKLIAAAVFVITVVSFNRYVFLRLAPYVFYPALLLALSQTPYSMLNKRFLIALPFCLFAGISCVLFDRDAAFSIGGITISRGFVSLAAILFKTWLSVLAVLLLVSVTRFSDLATAMHRLRLPDFFIIMFELTYRYIGVLLNETYSMSVAYSLRNSKKKGVEMRDMGSFAGQLLLRSFDRAERVYNAMKCRGYSSGSAFNYMGCNKRAVALHDIVYIAAVFIFCLTFRFVDVYSLFAGIMERFL
jgi:cobalt/nickel transport system permease protein